MDAKAEFMFSHQIEAFEKLTGIKREDICAHEVGDLEAEFMILQNYRKEMAKIEDATKGEVEDILQVAPYIMKLKEDENGFATSDWFFEKMNKHIHYHMVEEGGEYNYIHTTTGERVFELGKGGTMDECREYIEKLKADADTANLLFQKLLVTDKVEEKCPYCIDGGCGLRSDGVFCNDCERTIKEIKECEEEKEYDDC